MGKISKHEKVKLIIGLIGKEQLFQKAKTGQGQGQGQGQGWECGSGR